ncbi:hypothetical protein QQ045_020442 [Rhodiola kirilowii]
MNSAVATASSSSFKFGFPRIQLRKPNSDIRFAPVSIRASGGEQNDGRVSRFRIVEKIKKAAGLVVLTAATTAMIGKFGQFPARAENPMTTIVSDEIPVQEEKAVKESGKLEAEADTAAAVTPLAELLQTNSEAVEVLKALLQQKLENREDAEALKIVNQLVEAQPEVADWKYFKARMLNEMDLTEEARNAFEEILKADPLNYEALFENALLMNRCGEGAAVITRLEEAMRIAEEEGKGKEVRDVRLIIAQMKFLQNDIDEALGIYDELIKEDPSDFRPHFSKGMIYSLTDRNDEAKEAFAKYKQLSPKKFEVEGFLRTPLSRMLLFGSSEPDQI